MHISAFPIDISHACQQHYWLKCRACIRCDMRTSARTNPTGVAHAPNFYP